MIRKVFKIIKITISIPFLLLLVMFYLLSKNKILIEEDIIRYGNNTSSIKNLLLCFLFNEKSFRNVIYYRLGYNYSFILKIFYKENPTLHINENSIIGGGFLIVHGDCTYIWAKSIGNNVYINQGVTIGVVGDKSPVIGNNVRIATNSLVLGDVLIGDNVLIGAGTVIVKSVPSNCTVVGNPARIVKLNGEKVDISL